MHVFTFLQIIKLEKNRRTRGAYINKDYANAMKSVKVALNSKDSKQKTKKTHEDLKNLVQKIR